MPGMGRACLLWMLLTEGDLATLGLPGPWLPPRPPALLTGPEAGEPLRFLPSRPRASGWPKGDAEEAVVVEVVVVLPRPCCCWGWPPLSPLWWTKGPSESVESLLFITTLMRLMDSAGLAEVGPRADGSCRRLSPLVRPGVQFSPTV